jgi:hypothetical protein
MMRYSGFVRCRPSAGRPRPLAGDAPREREESQDLSQLPGLEEVSADAIFIYGTALAAFEKYARARRILQTEGWREGIP